MQSNVNFFLSAIAKITSCLGGPIALLDLQSAGKNEIHFITNCDWLGYSRFPHVRSLASICFEFPNLILNFLHFWLAVVIT